MFSDVTSVELHKAARIEDALAALAQGLALGEEVEGFTALLHQRAALLVDLYRGGEAVASGIHASARSGHRSA